MSFYQGPLKLELEGSLQLIGPSVKALQGGIGGTYVKTVGIPGEGILRISNEQVGEMKEIFYVRVKKM